MPKRPQSSPPRVVVIGGANTDFLIRAARLPRPGETITGQQFDHAEAGGKGANQAVAAARLGARVTFVGRIGADDRGRALLRRLAAEGIDVRHVVKDPHSHTGVAQISVDASGEKQILVAPGANQRLTAADVRRPAVARAIARAHVLILQFEVPLAANLAASRIAQRAGVPIVLDPAPALEGEGGEAGTQGDGDTENQGMGEREKGRGAASAAPDRKSARHMSQSRQTAHLPSAISHRLSALLRATTILRANEHEAEALTGIRVTHRQSAQKAAEHLLEKFGLRAAIIAAGEGNLAVWRENAAPATSAICHLQSKISSLFLPRIPVKAIDATGAGDAFAAALAVSLAEGQPLPDAARFANAAAALATTQLGAQPALPRRSALLSFLRSSLRRSAEQHLR